MRQILIVEDERPIREMIAFGLRRAGFEVVEAEDCKEARTRVADRLAMHWSRTALDAAPCMTI